MHIYSDTKVSEFLVSVTDDQRIGLVNDWNEGRDHREKIYVSYDSTNKNCQAGDIEFVEYGHPKDNSGLPIFNYSIACDTFFPRRTIHNHFKCPFTEWTPCHGKLGGKGY